MNTLLHCPRWIVKANLNFQDFVSSAILRKESKHFSKTMSCSWYVMDTFPHTGEDRFRCLWACMFLRWTSQEVGLSENDPPVGFPRVQGYITDRSVLWELWSLLKTKAVESFWFWRNIYLWGSLDRVHTPWGFKIYRQNSFCYSYPTRHIWPWASGWRRKNVNHHVALL